jgi:hypothetical protein
MFACRYLTSPCGNWLDILQGYHISVSTTTACARKRWSRPSRYVAMVDW